MSGGTSQVIVLLGSVPPKKNSRQIFVRQGRVINVPSVGYKNWEESCLWQLKAYKPILDVITGLTMTFWVPDNRRRDLDNMLGSVMDVLVKAEIIPDDTWQLVPEITIKAGGVDKANPRCEINIVTKQPNISGEVF